MWFNLSHVAVGLGDAPLALQVKTPVRPPTVTDSALKAGFPLRATANATQVLTVANAIAGGSASGSLGSLGGGGGGGGMAEAVANLAVLELQRQDHSAAAIHLAEAQRLGPQLFEPFFNGQHAHCLCTLLLRMGREGAILGTFTWAHTVLCPHRPRRLVANLAMHTFDPPPRVACVLCLYGV